MKFAGEASSVETPVLRTVCDNGYDLVRLRVRQGMKQDGIDDAEDCGVGGDPESERDDGNKRESRRSEQLAKSETEIV